MLNTTQAKTACISEVAVNHITVDGVHVAV